MYIPPFSPRRLTLARLSPRRGTTSSGGHTGGGSGGHAGTEPGGGGTTGKGGGSSGGAGGAGGAGSSGSSRSITVGGRSHTATSYGNGGGGVGTYVSGPWAGRTEGSGTRAEVYGTWRYGSGYPDGPDRGVNGRSFPFYYWPVVWGDGADSDSYIYNTSEYGNTTNQARPGGRLMTAFFQPNSTVGGSPFRIVADNDTVLALIATITTNCTAYLATTTIAATDFAGNSSLPKPEQAVQYYRASTAVLTCDAYNNTVIFAADNTTASASDSPVPFPAALNTTLLSCLNDTIGAAIPLIDAGGAAAKGGLSSEKIIGAVLGSIGGTIAIGLLICCWCCCRRESRRARDEYTEMDDFGNR
ncbi:hypothetical protein B0H15DRAFT_961126 [Mycena belliarum]|uniref:Uncharacterized protein n=1 Tax=Mycena belliarum TaxID=1033014 RepID=A0AAD6UF92_9AGAR|nr:hypothetical protein B0H15DRAFT_961126 [Mycena belliae]